MTREEIHDLTDIATTQKWMASKRLIEYLKTVQVTEVAPVPENAPTRRTGAQNRSLWKGFQLVADALTAKGVTMRKVFDKTEHFDIPPTKNSVHDLWIYFQERMYGTTSTTDLAKTEGQIDKVWEVMMKNLGEVFGMDYIDFPSEGTINVRLAQHDNLSREDYPEFNGPTTL